MGPHSLSWENQRPHRAGEVCAGAGKRVGVYLSRQGKKDILGKGNSMGKLKSMEQYPAFQEIQVFYDSKIE